MIQDFIIVCHTWDVSAVEVIKLCSGEAELLLNCVDEQQMKLFRPSALHIKLLSFFKSQNKTFFFFFFSYANGLVGFLSIEVRHFGVALDVKLPENSGLRLWPEGMMTSADVWCYSASRLQVVTN